MAPHSSTLAWKIPWTEDPGGLQSMGSLGVLNNRGEKVVRAARDGWEAGAGGEKRAV